MLNPGALRFEVVLGPAAAFKGDGVVKEADRCTPLSKVFEDVEDIQ